MPGLISRVFTAMLAVCASLVSFHPVAASTHASEAEPTLADTPIDLHFVRLATQLSTSRVPRDLYVAALLLDRIEVSKCMQGEVNEAPRSARSPVAEALMQRALDIGHDDPVLQWVAANDCPASAAVCDAPTAVQRLRRLAPNNAAVWILPAAGNVLGSAPWNVASDERDEELRLLRIANASRHDGYAGDRFGIYYAALARQPVPLALREHIARGGALPRPSEVRGMLVQMLHGESHGGNAQGLRDLCSTSVLSTSPPARRDVCLAALRRVIATADSPQLHVNASRLLAAMLPEGRERDSIERESTTLQWQLQAATELDLERLQDRDTRPGPDPREIKRWLEPGATALSVMQKTLRAAGVALDPPADWRPSSAVSPAPPSEWRPASAVTPRSE